MAVALALALGACMGGPPSGTPRLDVDFTWVGVAPCTTRSPRLVVRDIPATATRLRIELVDVDSAVSRHGGGEVGLPADGVIPPGALADYRGPCPQQNAIAYEFRVSALDATGKIVGYGLKRDVFTPTKLGKGFRR
ncbi:MAG: hypothetical protein KIT16_23450 [Rhodospirillaceae bacterium]|nr:hypothetical protein [Rhodospirillaceae bacterium]